MEKKIYANNITYGHQAANNLVENGCFNLVAQGTKGKIVGVVGRSGCGKTSLLKLIASIDKLKAGRITIEPSNARIAYIPQQPVIFNHLTIQENLKFFGTINEYRESYSGEELNRLVRLLQCEAWLTEDKEPIGLSGGERQKIALIRALTIFPDILLFDEPCIGLDHPIKIELLMQIRKIVDERYLLALYVSHYPDELALVADELLIFQSESSSEGAVSDLIHEDYISMLNKPLTVEIEKYVTSDYSNLWPCKVSNDVFLFLGTSTKVKRNTGKKIPNGEYLVSFSVNDAVLHESNGITLTNGFFKAGKWAAVSLDNKNIVVVSYEGEMKNNVLFTGQLRFYCATEKIIKYVIQEKELCYVK